MVPRASLDATLVFHVSFSKYAALVKNLRGVILLDLNEPGVMDSLQWLVKRFRYRNLGVTPSTISMHGESIRDYLGGRPLRELVAPVREIAELVDLFSRKTGLSVIYVESLVYASAYISPCLMIGDRFHEYVSAYSTDVVYTCKELSLSDWKLHLRIADYSILDMYEQSIDEVYVLLDKHEITKVEDLLKARATRVSRDKKRYWRLLCEKGRPFLYYVDLFKLAVENNLLDELNKEHSAGLGIIPVVHIPPGTK